MSPKQQMLIDKIRAQCGAQSVVTEDADLAPWLTDWRGRWTGKAPAMLEPRSTGDVAAMVRLAAEAGVPLVPQGGNTSMVGGATPDESGAAFILSLRRMNKVRQIDTEGRYAIVEAGLILQQLHEAAIAEGLRFPLTLGAKGSATVGGLISTNAGGTQVLRFGTMRGLAEGVEAVLPDGSVHDGLRGLKKDNRGFNLDQLLIGSEGTLGVVTAARLKLAPLPFDHATALVGLDDAHAALALLRRLQAATDRIEGFELIPDDSIAAGLQHLDMAAPLSGHYRAYALVEATGTGGEPSEALLQRLLGAELEAGRIADAVIASSEAQSAELWRLRDSLSEAEKKIYGTATQHDVSVPIDAMPSFLDEAKAVIEAEWPGVRVSGYGHLGDGNIHLHVRAQGRDGPGWIDGEGKVISRRVHDLVAAHGGSISAEHGIGQMKRDELARLAGPARIGALRAIKAAMDPKGIMNPGKLVP